MPITCTYTACHAAGSSMRWDHRDQQAVLPNSATGRRVSRRRPGPQCDPCKRLSAGPCSIDLLMPSPAFSNCPQPATALQATRGPPVVVGKAPDLGDGTARAGRQPRVQVRARRTLSERSMAMITLQRRRLLTTMAPRDRSTSCPSVRSAMTGPVVSSVARSCPPRRARGARCR